MDHEAEELVSNPGSVIHPLRRTDSGISMNTEFKWIEKENCNVEDFTYQFYRS